MSINQTAREQLVQIQTSYEESFDRIATLVHDQVVTALSNLKLEINMLWGDSRSTGSPKKNELEKINRLIDLTIEESRELMAEMRPPILDDLGLRDALEWQVRDIIEKTSLDIRLIQKMDDYIFCDPMKTWIFRLFQDLIKGLSIVAEATKVSVTFELKEDRLIINYRDNGISLSDCESGHAELSEMILIRARVFGLRGELIQSTSIPEGNDLCISLPLSQFEGENGGHP
jgi:signal transduction histidine kinase